MRSRDPDLNAERRQAILDAAVSCFVRQGFHATSMKDICAEAGMSPGTLYHYVRSKADIIAGIIDNQAGFSRALIEPLAEAADFRAALFDALDRFAAGIADRDLVLNAEIGAELLRQPSLRERAAEADRASRRTLSAAIAAALGQGALRHDLDPDDTAAMLLALIDGALWQATLNGSAHFAAALPALKAAIGRILSVPGDGCP
ncbi:TetR/AcrR family transcriptional regulator (plasmid) [Skermanella sp. TT6]|uniref:TetR/AcrR family transcriptional regulator n=1 Tax=Skermanella cutis TaxID=2775420 RepID=A0ABX7BGH5_9PROT|nr:TetR/AcrR family transcriptional regulator [Skermanella sp. TT6]QQP92700.1 TetR/AcrR family transcriptional regulator [Skermanella sp. TT6]